MLGNEGYRHWFDVREGHLQHAGVGAATCVFVREEVEKALRQKQNGIPSVSSYNDPEIYYLDTITAL